MMTEEEKHQWVNAIVYLCSIELYDGDTFYPMLESIFVKGEPILDDYPISYYLVDQLESKEYHEKYCSKVKRTRLCWRCSPRWG